MNNQYGNYMGLHINQNLYYYPQIPMMGYNPYFQQYLFEENDNEINDSQNDILK